MAVRKTLAAHTGLAAGIERARALAGDGARIETSRPEVSAWSVGDHLEHLLKAERGILGWIEETVAGAASDRAGARGAGEGSGGRPTARGRMVIGTGRIPRGRASAPERTVPMGASAMEIHEGFAALADVCDGLRERLDDVAASRATFEHPLLGHFTPRQWLRFLEVHHRHHETIIRDILPDAFG